MLGPRWDAVAADFTHYYRTNLRQAIREWPATDLVGHIKKLPPQSQLAREELGDMADWGHLAENVARLVDLFEFWLNAEYANWTADPDEVEAQRRRRKREGYRPPPTPLIEPVASRPESLREFLQDRFADSLERVTVPNEPLLISSDEWDSALGL